MENEKSEKVFYCEKCHFATEEDFCPVCLSKKIREVRDEDFCFFNKMDVFYFEMFENALKEENIKVVGVPFYPLGTTKYNAGRARGRNVYVRYKDCPHAQDIFDNMFSVGGAPTNPPITNPLED